MYVHLLGADTATHDANVAVRRRDALERLCRYVNRPAFAKGRLTRRADGLLERFDSRAGIVRSYDSSMIVAGCRALFAPMSTPAGQVGALELTLRRPWANGTT